MQRNPAVTRTSALLAGLLSGLFALSASAADASPELTPYEASYTASMSKGVSLNGEGVRTLTDQETTSGCTVQTLTPSLPISTNH